MNAYTATASGIALLGKKRAAQSVHVEPMKTVAGTQCWKVLVIPHGHERGEYFIVRAPSTLKALYDGMTPEELELDVFEPSEADMDDFERQFAETRHNNAMRRAGLYRA